MVKNAKVDVYIDKNQKYSDILSFLRKVLELTPLNETVKWGMPTYTFDNKNLIGIGAFKNYVSMWFFQGSLLKDKYQLLKNSQEGKTKAMRQIHFKTIGEINKNKLLEYILETIENQKNGLVIKPQKNTKPIIIPDELGEVFNINKKLEASFKELTPGKQREYTDYIESAKRDSTKKSRIEKIIPLVLEKKGLYDKYKNC
jgi:uncharacterized protein YdeI (YjbR/CyaY-like superfamily)